LSPEEYNDVMREASTYAEQGEDALYGYLQGLLNRGYLSRDEAADIIERYFPQSDMSGIIGTDRPGAPGVTHSYAN
jgi:hypothetical protein